VAAREWALLNPASPAKKPLTIEQVVNSPMVSDPLHRYDCCLVSDGGGALIVTSPERAADVCENPVYVTACAETHTARHFSWHSGPHHQPAALTGPRALRQAGLELADIDVFQLYDSFTIAVLITLEGLGLCPRGTAGEFVADGRLRPGDSLPVNTSGGRSLHAPPRHARPVPAHRGRRPAACPGRRTSGSRCRHRTGSRTGRVST